LALGQLCRTEEAEMALDQAIAIAPDVFDVYVHVRARWWRSEDHVRTVDALRKVRWRKA
jgi:hypothetical protein